MLCAVKNSAVFDARTGLASYPNAGTECSAHGINLVADASVERPRNDGQQAIKVPAAGTLVGKAADVDVMDGILMYAVLLAMMVVAGQVVFLSFVRIAELL